MTSFIDPNRPMSNIDPNRPMSNGSYVVACPGRTDAVGDMLRASFAPTTDGVDDINRLLAMLDRPALLS